jgi:predicted metal-dependent hydrolase
MELEQPSGDSAAVVDTAPADETTADATEPVQQYDDNGLPIEAAPVDDDEEDEVDGVKLRGKKEALEKLKAERLMQADYTRKTQEVAEQRRNFDAEREQFQKAAQTHQQYLREIGQLTGIDERLAQFSQVNWQALTDQDPVQALKLHTEFTQLQAHKGQLVNALTQKQQAAQQEQQRSTAKQLMEARQVLERDIKGWSPELAGKLVDFGIKQGFPPEAMQNITRPEVVKVIHKAFLYDQLQQQRAAKAPAAPAPPVTRLSGTGAVATKDPAQMSDAEFAAMRKRQIAQRRP